MTLRPSTERRTRVSIQGDRWWINGRVVHPDSPAEGLLTNVRMVNCIFEDTGPAATNLPGGFDPQENTRRFLARIPEYMRHGVAAFTIGLQGGLPGYEGAINSAFEADGQLRESYMARAGAVIEACDGQGAVVILSCFYQRQHSHERALAGREAIRRAVANVARWIARQGYTNVVLEISNECRHNGYARWIDGEWLASDAGQVELMRLARAEAPGLLVSTSGMGNGVVSEAIAREADCLLIHFNNTALEAIPERVNDLKPYGKPIVCNEDNKIGAAGAEAAQLAITSGAGWGFMHAQKNQYVPFEWDGAADDPEVYAMLRQLTTPGATVAARKGAAASIVITEPKDGDRLTAGSPVRILAAVTASGKAAVAKVEFLANGRQIGAALSSPWQVVWNPPAGRYDLVAVQFDAAGHELARSNAVDVVAE